MIGVHDASAIAPGSYQRPAVTAQAGRRYSLPLSDAAPETAAQARRFVQQHAPASIAEAAVLAASELVGNVVRHAPGPARVALTIRATVIVISVSDTHPEIPVLLPEPGAAWDLEAEHARGLAIIAAMGAELMARSTTSRKRVTARFPIGDINA